MIRTYTIEVRVELDADREATMREAARSAAKHLLTTATLISPGRAPLIALHTSDFFEGNEQIAIADDIPMDVLNPEEEAAEQS